MSSMFAQTEIFQPNHAPTNHAQAAQNQPLQFQASQTQRIQNSIIQHNQNIKNTQQYPQESNLNMQKFVMIDQQQLLELMQAKQILDAQRQGTNPSADGVEKPQCQAPLFTTPQKHDSSFSPQLSNARTSTKQESAQDGAQDETCAATASSRKVAEANENCQEQSLFRAPFMFDLDDEFANDEQDAKNCGLIYGSSQRNNIKNDLLNMIDDEASEETSEFNVPPTAKLHQQKIAPYGQAAQQQLDSFVSALQNIDLQTPANKCTEPHSQQPSGCDSTLDLTSGSAMTGNSIFSSHSSVDPFYSCHSAPHPSHRVASTINNIVINNFNGPEFQNASAKGAVASQAPLPFFPPLNSVMKQGPTIEQAAELAQVTQMAGGVKPLHHSNKPARTQVQGQANNKAEKATSGSPAEKKEEKPKEERRQKKSFDFPEGGWECCKCQNYNFKGRKECFRCKKTKSEEDHDGKPTHMFLPAEEKAALKAAKSKKNKMSKAKKEAQQQADLAADTEETSGMAAMSNLNQINAFATSNPFVAQDLKPKAYQQRQGQAANLGGAKKTNQERVGDWTCQRCFNHNYAFRDVCNMCYLSHIESNKMLYNQQQNRLESVQSIQCQQPPYFPQPPPQFSGSPMQNNFMPPSPPQEAVAPPILTALGLSQSAKPFIPTYLKRQTNAEPGQQSPDGDLAHSVDQKWPVNAITPQLNGNNQQDMKQY